MSPKLVAAPVALLLTLPAAAPAAAPAGTYKGETNQERTVTAKIGKGNKLKRLSFSVYTLCGIGGSGGGSTDVLLVENVKIKSNGTFKVSSKGDSSNGLATYDLRGKVKGSKLTGSIEQFFRNGCQTFDLKFTAKRR